MPREVGQADRHVDGDNGIIGKGGDQRGKSGKHLDRRLAAVMPPDRDPAARAAVDTDDSAGAHG
jgi:hypothetical protein